MSCYTTSVCAPTRTVVACPPAPCAPVTTTVVCKPPKAPTRKVCRESTSTETEVVECHLPKRRRVKHVVQE